MRNPAAIATLPDGASDRAEGCPVLGALTVVGDFWTLGVLRCVFNGLNRFGEVQQELGIATNVLADRLGRLVDAGILARVPYGAQGARHGYALTRSGADLGPVLLALRAWGERHVATGHRPAVWRHRGCASPVRLDVVCPDCGAVLDAGDVEPAAADRAG